MKKTTNPKDISNDTYYYNQDLNHDLTSKIQAQYKHSIEPEIKTTKPHKNSANIQNKTFNHHRVQNYSYHQSSNAENMSQNISNTNSPHHDQNRSAKKTQQSNVMKQSAKKDITQSISQQKLSTILGFMAGRTDIKFSSQTLKTSVKLQNSSGQEGSQHNISIKPHRQKSLIVEIQQPSVDHTDINHCIEQLVSVPTNGNNNLQPIKPKGEYTKLKKNSSLNEIAQPSDKNKAQSPSNSPGITLNGAGKNHKKSESGSFTYVQSTNRIPGPQIILQPSRSQKFTQQTQPSLTQVQSDTQSEKLRSKLKSLILEIKNNSDETREKTLFLQFNTLIQQICSNVIVENKQTKEDQAFNFFLENLFKKQNSFINSFYQLTQEKILLDQNLNSLKKKFDSEISRLQQETASKIQGLIIEKEKLTQNIQTLIIEKTRLTGEYIKLKNNVQEQSNQKNSKTIQNVKQQKINEKKNQVQVEPFDEEKQELKYLVQGQFEAIQKLLQREQLMKIFLKKVGDSHIIQMFENFVNNAEAIEQNQTEGNLHIDMIQNKESPQITALQRKPHKQDILVNKFISKYEESYKQLNIQDSLLADDSRINDSDESSFGFMGKEEATEISVWYGPGENLNKQQNKKEISLQTKKVSKIPQRQLSINIQELQHANKNSFSKDSKKQIKMLKEDISDESEELKIIVAKEFSCPSKSDSQNQ